MFLYQFLNIALNPSLHLRFLGWIMGLSASIKFSGKQDLVVQDDCDKTIRNICQINSGWSDELDNIRVEILEA